MFVKSHYGSVPFFVSLPVPGGKSLCNFSDPPFPVKEGRGRKEHHETVESGDTGGGSASGFTRRSWKTSGPPFSPQQGPADCGRLYSNPAATQGQTGISCRRRRKNQAATTAKPCGFRQPALASDPSGYYAVNEPTKLPNVFEQIANKFSKLQLTN
ncbi:hypothetical protein BPNPMPFG_000071 [Mesorhizobium sp. AR07]|uniref:hypothetical protein n=1 Tax=Mesorhizobium sp. AR07 TaxID=2865838 RepID=UPI00215E81A8|nr:hypothetical protein [Mesorhizobium sp. AR07]UVK48007.1 hypothetical protein BPNPMPFG_000071 [Mesorhizobium sp. AR07]